MPGKIEINNIRNIKKLVFEIPDRGVWLLTAGNGAGKTSLLACLRRINYPNAFPVHFPSSLRSSRLDNHSNGSVSYEINGKEVSYAYRGERWTPRPRGNSNLFDMFGYSSVTYIGATADRITPRPEDFEPRLVKGASRTIIDAANEIFETEKFTALRTINLSRGVGNDAFVLAVSNNPATYHSEKHFSLGELCVLKLLRHLGSVGNNSMIIVDELEIALHPRAQIRLLRYLNVQAKAKNLTVIFSTHSVTLLKSINRKNIIYLDKQDDGEVIPIYGCFPTYAIGNISSDEETLPDIMIYVEDLFAREVTTAFFEKFTNDKYSDPTTRPTAKIVPVGGFKEVVHFLERNKSVLPDYCTQRALLDEDVSSEILRNWEVTKNHAQLAKIRILKDEIKYLPFTPEVGVMNYIINNKASFERNLRVRCSDNQLRISDQISGYDQTLKGKQLRAAAKSSIEKLTKYICVRTQASPDIVREQLSGVFANATWSQYKNYFMTLFGEMVS